MEQQSGGQKLFADMVQAKIRRVDQAAEIERLQRNLDGRDAFIVAKGLWSEFVAQLPVGSQQEKP